MKKVLWALVVVAVSGCAPITKEVELPKDGSGTDELKVSPCVCDPVEFDGGGFAWIG